jgi:hypothetical protein
VKRVLHFATAAVVAAGVLASAPAASASVEKFDICSSGLSGVVTPDTSCGFADNVYRAFYSQVDWTVFAFSPATGLIYTMQCANAITDVGWDYPKRCFGVNGHGDPLVVYIA